MGAKISPKIDPTSLRIPTQAPYRRISRDLCSVGASGTERVFEGEHYLFGGEETPVPVRVVLRRIGSREAESPFLVLATWKVNPGEATGLYRRYQEIESMFAAPESRGFDLEATDLTDPSRAERPVSLLALAFI